MIVHVCSLYGYTYYPEDGDPEECIPPFTDFYDIPDDWVCPICGASKWDFVEQYW